MDSVFCFEIAIEKVQLLPQIGGSNLFAVCSFLDYPTIVIYATNKQKNNLTKKKVRV